MKKMLRWGLRLLVGGVLLLVVAVLARNFLLRKGLEAVVTQETGFPFTIDSISLGLLDAGLDVKGMRLSNPPGFEDPRCFDIPRVAVDLDGGSLFKKTLHMPEVILEVQEVVVVRNAAGETNLDRLKALGAKEKEEPAEKAPAKGEKGEAEGDGKPGKPKKWKIDRLELTLRRVVYLDYTKMKDGKPKEEVFDLKVDHEVFKDVDGPRKIVKLIVLKILKGTPIKLLTETVDSLTEGVGGAVGGAAGALEQGVKGVGDALGGLLGGDKKEPEKKKRR